MEQVRGEELHFHDATSELAGSALTGNGVHASPIAPVERDYR
jgi:hypothetical protein